MRHKTGFHLAITLSFHVDQDNQTINFKVQYHKPTKSQLDAIDKEASEKNSDVFMLFLQKQLKDNDDKKQLLEFITEQRYPAQLIIQDLDIQYDKETEKKFLSSWLLSSKAGKAKA